MRAMPVIAVVRPVQKDGQVPASWSAATQVLRYGDRTARGTAGGRTGSNAPLGDAGTPGAGASARAMPPGSSAAPAAPAPAAPPRRSSPRRLTDEASGTLGTAASDAGTTTPRRSMTTLAEHGNAGMTTRDRGPVHPSRTACPRPVPDTAHAREPTRHRDASQERRQMIRYSLT